MTYHFINLISWRFFIENYDNSKLNVDSISLKILLFFFGYKVKRSSGISYKPNEKNSLYLTDRTISKNHIILPFYKDISTIKLSSEIKTKLELYDNIIIGISSPKQDRLGRLIHNIYPEKKIYCLGAAVYDNNFMFDKIGLNWIIFLIKKPKRTISKIIWTIIEIISIVSIYRREFRQFAEKINYN